MTTQQILTKAKQAVPVLATLSTDKKNSALLAMAKALEDNASYILDCNAKDMEASRGKIKDVMLDRLLLTRNRIHGMAEGIREVVALEDPVGITIGNTTTSEGLDIRKVSVPMGVIAIIYESRPNVTSDAASLCLKSGNVCVLRSGKEAFNSSHAIVEAMRKGLESEGLPPTLVNIIEDTTRDSSYELMKANGYVDLLIPRGGASLIRACIENATVPCIETGTGICSVYVDKEADQDKALSIIENAKTQRPSVCNAEETLLVDESIAKEFLPKVKKLLVDDRRANGKGPVELRLCEKSLGIITGTPATDSDFDTEFLDYILAVKVVNGVAEAVNHIGKHSTHHSEAIITENKDTAAFFVANIDSAAVYVNASTRFTDGGEFGLGCEMGISTQKLHARGPLGLKELCSYKYIITGNGQVRK